jgi:hypothetical protein
MKTYKLLKDWDSKRHGKTIKAGTFVIIKDKKEKEYLSENEIIKCCITKKKKSKKIK